MAGLSDYVTANFLNYITGSLMVPSSVLTAGQVPPNLFLALFTTAPTSKAGTGGTEVSTSSTAYARLQVGGSATVNATTLSSSNILHFASTPAWIFNGTLCIAVGFQIRDATTPSAITAGTTITTANATSVTMSANAAATVGASDVLTFSAFAAATPSSGTEPVVTPGQIANTNAALSFPTAALSWGVVVAFGLYDAVTSGNFVGWDWIGNFKWLPFTCNLATPGVFTSPAHGYANGDPVVVTSEFGGTLPTTGGSFAGVLTVAGAATDTFNVAVNTTSTGDGEVRKIVQQNIPANVTATFAAGSLTLTLA